jgi:hypothetical protein
MTAADRARLWLPVVAGAGVAVGLGVYGRLHQPAVVVVDTGAYLRLQTVKAWLATAVVLLLAVQTASAFRRHRRPGARWPAALHWWSGRLALALSLPVAAHCLYALGIHTLDGRVLGHALCGCLFYGAFLTRTLLSRTRSWAVPVAGGVVFAAVVGLWLLSALWFFGTVGTTF